MKKIQQSYFNFSAKNVFLFCFIWFCVGFTIGTFVLICPVHWITDHSATNNWSSSRENVFIKIVIILYVILSFFISVRLLTVYYKIRTKTSIIFFFTILISLTASVLWLWFNPELMGSINPQNISAERTKDTRFFFGPYPSESTLYDLKENDYTLVISLLNPAVVPFEPKLINDEEKAVSKVGIKYINIPLLPWVSDNVEAINKLKEIIKNEKGKVYVHCYLGKDRVNVVKNIIKNNNGIIDKSAEPEESRRLADVTKFERGDIIKLEPDVFLIPYPTDEEYFSFILTSPIKHIVSLLNPLDKEDLVMIEKEKKLLPQYGINLHQIPLIIDPYNPDAVLDIVQKIKKLPRPIVIHAFFTKGVKKEAIELTYKNQKQSLPPSLFLESMANGVPTVMSSNVVAGMTPLESEFKSYLYSRGIRNIAFTGNIKAKKVNVLETQAIKSGLKWRNFNLNNPALLQAIKTDGTWYIYGSPIEEIQKKLNDKIVTP